MRHSTRMIKLSQITIKVYPLIPKMPVYSLYVARHTPHLAKLIAPNRISIMRYYLRLILMILMPT